MNSRKNLFKFLVILTSVVLAGGCFPEEKLKWSDDGSTAVLQAGNGLYLVDAQTCRLTEIEKEGIVSYADISGDGKWLAYCRSVDCPSLSEGLAMLPAGQVRLVEYYAQQTAKTIVSNGGLIEHRFPVPKKEADNYADWVIHYVCENFSDARELLAEEDISKNSERTMEYYQLIVAPCESPDQKRVVATNLSGLAAPQFSPDLNFVAYIMAGTPGNSELFSLYVASLTEDDDVRAMIVDYPVAIGYSWRDDSRAVAYLCAESDAESFDDVCLGTLRQYIIADEAGLLLSKPKEFSDKGCMETHTCTSGSEHLAGTIFFLLSKVEYGIGGRIFFSSISISLPAGNLENKDRWSVFCYDPLTQAVTNILPADLTEYLSEEANLFSLSPDGTKLLLPLSDGLTVYTLGKTQTDLPVEKLASAGISTDIVPAWKGNDEISCLLSAESELLKDPDEQSPGRDELVIISADGQIKQVLSHEWPDDIGL